jgi:putative transposase
MAKEYSLDLRKKVISFVTKGGSKREAAKLFTIGEDTVYRWIRRDKLRDLAPKKRTDFPTKVPLETLRKYVEDHPDHTLKEIGEAVNLSASKVWKHLQKLNLTRKKRPHSTKNAMKLNGESLGKSYQK